MNVVMDKSVFMFITIMFKRSFNEKNVEHCWRDHKFDIVKKEKQD